MSLLPFDLPPPFVAYAARSPKWATWIEGVPRLVGELLDEWELAVDGAPMHGNTALVVPVRTGTRRAVLKVAWPHDEGRHEILALQHWHGHGAVQLIRADPRRNAMLLERLHPTNLTRVGDVEACEIVAGLYGLLHLSAPKPLLTLSSYVREWTDALTGLSRSAPLPRRIVDQAVHLGRELAGDPATDGVMIHGDLHFENVLSKDRTLWLAIDPKPMSGDPHYELAPLLWNRWEEIVASGNVRDAVRRRFHAVVDVAGLDEGRARDWVVVREAHNAMWAIDDDEPDRVTTAIAIIKAVQE